MKAIANSLRITYDEHNKPELSLSLTCHRHEIASSLQELKDVLAKGKLLSVEIKQHRKIRSLDANSYAWVLMTKIGDCMRPPIRKDDVYIEMLKRYGQREKQLLSVVSEAADMIYRATKNHCCEVGESELNGKTFKHFAILIGSSEYDTKEMSIFIDGIVQDAKELDIETMTKEELESLKKEWNGK
jgi:hypothetical protein